MKKIFILSLLILSCIIFACKSDKSDNENDTLTNKVDTTVIQNDVELGKEYTSKYICPNHCKGSGSDVFGTCPVCGMEYIENFDYKE